MLAVNQADGHGDGQGITVLKGDSAFEAFNVVGQGDVIIGSLHRFLHHLEGCGILSAESYFAVVVKHQFVGSAWTSDGTDVPAYSLSLERAFPVFRI